MSSILCISFMYLLHFLLMGMLSHYAMAISLFKTNIPAMYSIKEYKVISTAPTPTKS